MRYLIGPLVIQELEGDLPQSSETTVVIAEAGFFLYTNR